MSIPRVTLTARSPSVRRTADTCATPRGQPARLGREDLDRDRIECKHVVVVRHDEPGPDRGREVHRLGGRHVAGHAPRGIPAVDRAETARRTVRAESSGQAVVGQGVAAMIQPAAVGLDHVPQIKVTAPVVGVEPLVAPTGSPGRESRRIQPGFPHRAQSAGPQAGRGSRHIRARRPGNREFRRGRRREQVGQRAGVEVVGVLVAGQDEIDPGQVSGRGAASGSSGRAAGRSRRTSSSGAPRDKGRSRASRTAT